MKTLKHFENFIINEQHISKSRVDLEKIISDIDSNFIFHIEPESWGTTLILMEKQGKAYMSIYWHDDDNTTIYIDYISVDVKVQKQGIGTKLKRIAEEIGTYIGSSYTQTLVDKNKWLYEWYKKCGYADYKYYDKDYIWMRKSLK